jgi:phospholipid methyltransferase
MAKEIFRYQIWHLVSVVILIAVTQIFVAINYDTMTGALWKISTKAWFWIAITVPIFHQVYVWIIWRLELYKNTFTSRYGIQRAFKIYSVGFSLLFVCRLIFIIILAISSQDSLAINPLYTYLVAALITPVVIYLFYSVIRYFTIERAFGIDHFDKNYNKPYVKGGIFSYTDNGMYVYGLMIFYLPGLLLLSKTALVVALFNHIYIWVHYYCTERPDMKVIYGNTPGN